MTTTYNNQTLTLLADIGLRTFALPQTMDIGNSGAPNIDNRYDLAGRLTAANPGTAYGRTYSHDANGNTTGISIANLPMMNQQFTYDHLDRLDSFAGPFGATTFGYDALGNRTRRDENGLVDTFTYQQGTNRLSYIDRSDGEQTALSYDGRGNTTAIGDRVLTYNQDNRLARVDDSGFVAEYVYNGLGQRVIKTTAGATTYFHYDFGGRMIAETPGYGSVTLGKEYVYNGKVLLAHVEVETGAVYSFHTNYLGAVHQLTDNSGAVVWEGIYKPFGQAVVNPGSTITNHWRLPGQYYDEETGLYYNYYRYYNPAIGRYLTPDPIGLDGGINRYGYAYNNPANLVDPFGLSSANECGQMHVDFLIGVTDELISQYDSVRGILPGPDILTAWQIVLLQSVFDANNKLVADYWGVQGARSSKAYWAGRAFVIAASIYVAAEGNAARGSKSAWDDVIKFKYKGYDKLGAHEKKIAGNILDRFQLRYMAGTGDDLSNIRNVRNLKDGLYEIESKQGVRVYIDKLGNVLGYGNKNSQVKDIPKLRKLLKAIGY